MSDYTPTVEAFRGVYGRMCAEWCRDDALAEFDRLIARIKAEAAAEALLTDEAVERAARALCVAAGEDPDSNELWDEEPPWLSYADEARAALTAAIGDDHE